MRTRAGNRFHLIGAEEALRHKRICPGRLEPVEPEIERIEKRRILYRHDCADPASQWHGHKKLVFIFLDRSGIVVIVEHKQVDVTAGKAVPDRSVAEPRKRNVLVVDVIFAAEDEILRMQFQLFLQLQLVIEGVERVVLLADDSLKSFFTFF